jgi:D-alanine-D-alanine ligase
MKVAIIYNKDRSGVINKFGMQNKERYNPKTVKLAAEALEQGGHNVAIIDGNMDVIQQLQDFMPRVMEGERMGMVFNMKHFRSLKLTSKAIRMPFKV